MDRSLINFSVHSQKNGASERKNRSIMEMVMCMIHQKELLKKLYVSTMEMTEAASTNRSITKMYEVG